MVVMLLLAAAFVSLALFCIREILLVPKRSLSLILLLVLALVKSTSLGAFALLETSYAPVYVYIASLPTALNFLFAYELTYLPLDKGGKRLLRAPFWLGHWVALVTCLATLASSLDPMAVTVFASVSNLSLVLCCVCLWMQTANYAGIIASILYASVSCFGNFLLISDLSLR